MKVHIIDVNDINGLKPQFGDCFLIEVEGKFILIDGGVTYAGQKVRSYLDKIGVNTLELVIVTHLHSDHVDGIITSILREGEEENRININQVWAPDPKYIAPFVPPREELLTLKIDYEDPNYALFGSPAFSIQSVASYFKFEDLLSRRDPPISLSYQMADAASKPQTLGITNFVIEVLGPSQEMLNDVLKRLKELKGDEEKLIMDYESARSAGRSLKKMDLNLKRLYDSKDDAYNDTSIIVKITYKHISFLFTGDAEIASLEYAKKGGKLPYKMKSIHRNKMQNVSVLKVPHHGSVNGIDSRGKIIDLVQPKNAVITARAGDSNHPYPKLLKQLKKKHIAYYLTTRNQDGIVITTDGTEPDFGNAEEGGDNPGT